MKKINYSGVEAQLKRIFYEILYAPLVGVLSEATTQSVVLNAAEDWLRNALRTGQVQYSDGLFSGQFSAKISGALRALGASLDKRAGTFSLPPEKVPGWISAEAGHYKAKTRDFHAKVSKTLDQIQLGLGERVDGLVVDGKGAIDSMEQGFRPAAEKLQIPWALSDHAKAALLKDYDKNMKLWIKKFSLDQIQTLRRKVEANAAQGYRFDQLIDQIEHQYNVSKTKATFLARQETSLYTSKFRQQKFTDHGFTHYRWATANDERVRDNPHGPNHKRLNNRIFAYSSPPIVDLETGRKANPGQDFNCRCVDVPIVGGVVEAEMVAA